MFKKFEKDEERYLEWVQNNPNGFIVNADEPASSTEYPMVHRATHRLMTSPKKQNYTTGRYFKVCSNDMKDLETWAKQVRGRSLNPCRKCM